MVASLVTSIFSRHIRMAIRTIDYFSDIVMFRIKFFNRFAAKTDKKLHPATRGT